MKYKVPTYSTDGLLGAACSSDSVVFINTRAGKANRIQATRIEILSVNTTGRRIHCKITDSTTQVVMERIMYREWVVRAWEKFSADWPLDE